MEKLSRLEKEKRENEKSIIASAEKLFFTHGYDNTSMDLIAETSEYTKRTIYRYFTCKEDLYFAVMLKGHKKMSRVAEELPTLSGKEKIHTFCRAYMDFYFQNRPLFDLIGQIKAIHGKKDVSELPYYRKYAEYVSGIHRHIIAVFEEACADGSIRGDLPPKELALTFLFLIMGYFEMMSLNGENYTAHYGLNPVDFADTSLSLLIELLDKTKE